MNKTPHHFRANPGRPSVAVRKARRNRETIAKAHDPYKHLASLLSAELGVSVPAEVVASWKRSERIRVWQLVARAQMAGAAACPVWPDCLAAGVVHQGATPS